MSWKYTPGSDEAIKRGCVCPVFDNHGGSGWGGDGALYGWVVVEYCPIHGAGEQREPNVHIQRENTRACQDNKTQ